MRASPCAGRGATQIIIRVLNGATEGATTVRVASASIEDPVGPIAFEGAISVPSGLLRVGDGADLSILRIQVPVGDVRIRVHVDAIEPDFYSPELVDIVLTEM